VTTLHDLPAMPTAGVVTCWRAPPGGAGGGDRQGAGCECLSHRSDPRRADHSRTTCGS